MTTSKKLSFPNVTGNHSMSWKELSEADDLASTITVDAFLGFTTHKMTEMKIRIPERIRLKLRDALVDFQERKCYDTAYSTLTSDISILKPSWRSDERFRNHVYRYLLLFDDRSGVEIRPCCRYASEGYVGAAVFATKHWKKGSRINTLVGCIAELNKAEELAFLKHHKNDFSVMYSSRKNCSQLWLGPAAFVNHDCQPNCEFTINCAVDARMSLEAKADIKSGDEIFIYYGNHFFDVNNSACECFTCELLGRGYFSKFENGDLQLPIQEGDQPTCSDVDQIDSGKSDKINYGNTSSGVQPGGSQVSLTSLRKGSSAGLARRSMPTSYSLRHTDSRLNRVKARLLASAEKTSASDRTATSSTGSGSRSATPKASRLDDSPRQPARRSVRLPSSATGSSSLPAIDSAPRVLPRCPPPLLISDWSAIPSTTFSDSSPASSPFPPQLERMPSESVGTASTAGDTPDLSQSFYQNPAEPKVPAFTFQRDTFTALEKVIVPSCSHEASVNGWDGDALPCYLSSGNSSATSPASAVEPILGQLWIEALPDSLSSPCRSEHSSPPLLTRQQASAHWSPVDGTTTSSSSLFDVSMCRLPTAPKPSGEMTITGDPELTPSHREATVQPSLCVTPPNSSADLNFLDCPPFGETGPAHLSSVSNVLDCSLPNFTPVSQVGSHRLPDDKPHLVPSQSNCSFTSTDRVSRGGEQNHQSSEEVVTRKMQYGIDYGASPPELRTPLRTKGNLNYLYTEHDYAKRTLLPSNVHSPSFGKVVKLCGSQFVSKMLFTSKLPPLRVGATQFVDGVSDSPSPSKLLPVTGIGTDSQPSTLLSVLREPSVYPVKSGELAGTGFRLADDGHCFADAAAAAAAQPDRLWSASPMMKVRHRPVICSDQKPLLVTLKRISATRYQISKPSRFFLTK